jgi:hypothetical protein
VGQSPAPGCANMHWKQNHRPPIRTVAAQNRSLLTMRQLCQPFFRVDAAASIADRSAKPVLQRIGCYAAFGLIVLPKASRHELARNLRAAQVVRHRAAARATLGPIWRADRPAAWSRITSLIFLIGNLRISPSSTSKRGTIGGFRLPRRTLHEAGRMLMEQVAGSPRCAYRSRHGVQVGGITGALCCLISVPRHNQPPRLPNGF